MGKRTVQDAAVTDIQKRRSPTKHYVFVIHVSWSDDSVSIIYRRYSEFFEFQMKLYSVFPEEAGARDPTQRIIPFLPGKKFRRSHTREVASKRLTHLHDYCQVLVKLPSKVSDSDSVAEFFTPTLADINPILTESMVLKKGEAEIDSISEPIQPEPYVVIADYMKNQRNEVELHAGDRVEVFEKNANGWWFVSSVDNQGWAPGTFLERADGEEDEECIKEDDKHYVSNSSYTAVRDDELSFEKGSIITVVEKTLDGWWKVKKQDTVGWAPATFLQVYKGPLDITPSSPTQRIGNVMTISDIGRRNIPPGQNGSSNPKTDKIHVHHGIESKPTPPRRSTVKRSVRKGAVRVKRPPKKVKEYYTIADFASSAGDSLSFHSGQKVAVINESDPDWWLVIIDGEEGWAPSTYIEGKEVKIPETKSTTSSSVRSLDKETGESRPVRPPPPSATSKLSSDLSTRPLPTPTTVKQPVLEGSSTSAFRPIPQVAKASRVTASSISRGPLPTVPMPLPTRRQKAAPRKSSDFILSAKASLVPASKAQQSITAPSIDRSNKPVFRQDTASKVEELKDQLERTLTTDGAMESAASYVTTGTYVNPDEGGLSFDEGVRVEIIEQHDSGWWVVRIDQEEGWVPSTYLEPI